MSEQRVLDLLREALRRPPADRSAFLDRACGNDALRAEIESLLDAEDDTFLSEPLFDLRRVGSLRGSFGGASSGGIETPHASADPRIGAVVGRYVIERRIGRGGMGVVYAARDTLLDRIVALKFLPSYQRANPVAQARFLREARAASALDHPGICTIYEIAEEQGGDLYIAMACYDGRTLDDPIAEGPLPLEQAMDVFHQTADALARAHAAGIVHRDVKPSNLMVTPHGVVKVLDFGVAKLDGAEDLTEAGDLIGTFAYMAPEQARGLATGHEVDVWALGVVAYEMLTGVHPFRRETPGATLHAVQQEEPLPMPSLRSGVPRSVQNLVAWMLEKDAVHRCPSLDILRDELPDLPRRRSLPHPRSERTDRVAAAAVLIAIVFALVWGVWWSLPETGAQIRSRGAGPIALAVLPIEAPSSRPDHAPLAAGMTEALVADLGRLNGARVYSGAVGRKLAASDRPIREAAREFGIGAVVTGSVEVGDSLIGIRVQLVDAETEQIIWSRHYQEPRRDVVRLQHDVALTIAREIEAALGGAAEAHLANAEPVDPDAYAFYVAGLYERNRESPGSWRRAITAFEAAIIEDPAYAPAYAALSLVLVKMRSEDPAERTRLLADRALALDPDLPDAYVAQGLIAEFLDWDWEAAETAFRHAIHLQPGSAEAYHELGLLLARQRRFEAALSAVQQSLHLDPIYPRYLNGVAAVHLYAGRRDEALTLLRQSLAMDSTNPATWWRIGMAHEVAGDFESAVSAFERMVDLGGGQPIGHLGHALALAGRTVEAESLLSTLPNRFSPADEGWISFNRALIRSGLGDAEAAVDDLEAAAVERSNPIVYLAALPPLRPLHGHPRFQALLERVGLPPLAPALGKPAPPAIHR